jgi:hypothetical protein
MYEPHGLIPRRSVENALKLTSDAETTFEPASTSSSRTCRKRRNARPRLSSLTEVGYHVIKPNAPDAAAVAHIQQLNASQTWLYQRNDTLEQEIKDLRA